MEVFEIENQEFIPLNKLLLENNEKIKRIKTIFKREQEYADTLGPIEYTIASFYREYRGLKDKDVTKAIKNIRLNYYNELEYFKEPLEIGIMFALSNALQERKITKHELWLVLSYIVWCIDNRKWMFHPRAYLDWVLNFFGMMDQDEKDGLKKFYEELGERHNIDKEKIKVMTGSSGEWESIEEDKEWNKKDSEYFAMNDDEKYEYLLKCEEEPDCEFANFGMGLEKKGEFEKAEKLYKRWLEMDPEDFGGYLAIGMLYQRINKFMLAETHLKNALKLALEEKKEDPECIDDEVIYMIRKGLDMVKELKEKSKR